MFENIPDELKQFGQWINWRYGTNDTGKPTKHPVIPGIGHLASVVEPTSWRPFWQAVEYARANAQYIAGIGFVFTKNDSYSGIDLDGLDDPEKHARAMQIVEHFNSYTEYSPSGKGLHIIVKGKVTSGRRRDNVELYPHGRFFTMTGNVFRNAPIASRHYELEQLWTQLGGARRDESSFEGDPTERNTDLEVYEMAAHAKNGEKFVSLWQGLWADIRDEQDKQRYTSQSEADFALVDVLAYYTQNRQQIARLFRYSALGKRDKAMRDDYVTYMVNKSFDRMLPNVNIDAIINEANDARARFEAQAQSPAFQPPQGPASPAAPIVGTYVAPALADVFPVPFDPIVPAPATPSRAVATSNPYTKPPGLVGELADYILSSVYSPVPEYAIAGALALTAGLAGRAFNVSGDMGLNLFIVVNGGTATGKDGIRTAINKIIEQMCETVDADGNFMPEGAVGYCPSIKGFAGPSHIASGQAIGKYLINNPSLFCIIGEWGHKLRALTQPRSSNDELLKATLLDLYTSSGAGKLVQPYIYADKEKNTEAVESPALTLLCEGTPDTFYNKLDEDVILDGFVPRFLIIDFPGYAPEPVEENTRRRLPGWLRARIGSFVTTCVAGNVKDKTNRRSVTIPQFSPEADAMQKAFGKFCRDQIRANGSELITQIWSRAHAKVLKVAALVAIGCDWHNPIIQEEHIAWAKGLIVHEVEGLLHKFQRGDLGSSGPYKADERKQGRELAKKILQYRQTDFLRLANAQRTTAAFHAAQVIPHAWLMQQLANVAAFRNDPTVKRSSDAIAMCVKTLIEADVMGELATNAPDFKIRFGNTVQKVYYIKDWAYIEGLL